MSINTDPTNGCAGKQRFETFTLASRVARKSSRRRERAFQPYKCHHCNDFHFGGHTQRTNGRPELPPLSDGQQT